MKKSIITVASALLVLAVSCNNKQQSATTTSTNEQSSIALELKTIDVDEFVKHPKSTNNGQGLHYKISFTYPAEYENKAVLETLQRKFISYVLGADYASLTPETAVKTCIEDWKKAYNNDTKEYPLVYEYTCTNSIIFVNDVLLQMGVYNYVQQGGAHGFGGSSSHLFNLQTGKEYSRNDIFNPDKADEIRWTIIEALQNYLGLEEGDETPDFGEDVWSENTNFAVNKEGIVLNYDNSLGYNAIQEPIAIPYINIMPCLRENTPVWELAKEIIMNALNEKNRTLLANAGIGIGSTLEDLLKHYSKFKIDIYYDEMGSFEYDNLEDMLNAYGEEWYSAYNDWAIFTPLNQNGKEAEIKFFISFKNLDNQSKYKKESKIWMVINN